MLQKRVAAIHDISGFGKCSLTVVLPILSAAGVETSVIPTAVLSTHMGGLDGFTYRDLTNDMLPFAAHWKSLNLHFDAIYTGFLGSYQQIDIVSKIIDLLKGPDTVVMVDPCMADDGKLYKSYTQEMARDMKNLCAKADIIVPNITEACMLLGEEYRPGPYSREFIEEILLGLSKLGCNKIVLTGVSFDGTHLGAACYSADSAKTEYAFSGKIDGSYHGTGDVFASALLSGLLNDFALTESTQLAIDFTCSAIKRTHDAGTDRRFGVNFEHSIPMFLKRLSPM